MSDTVPPTTAPTMASTQPVVADSGPAGDEDGAGKPDKPDKPGKRKGQDD